MPASERYVEPVREILYLTAMVLLLVLLAVVVMDVVR